MILVEVDFPIQTKFSLLHLPQWRPFPNISGLTITCSPYDSCKSRWNFHTAHMVCFHSFTAHSPIPSYVCTNIKFGPKEKGPASHRARTIVYHSILSSIKPDYIQIFYIFYLIFFHRHSFCYYIKNLKNVIACTVIVIIRNGN